MENVSSLEESQYADLKEQSEQRDGGRFELRIRTLEDAFGGSWASFRVWRTDLDDDDDAPVLGPESDANTEHEQTEGYRGGNDGFRLEGEFWRNEWIDHQAQSIRVRGDADHALPQFIVDTDGSRLASGDLGYEDVGRWLWFKPSVATDLLSHRGFSLKWYTSETGSIRSTSGYTTHFGINSSDLITVYAHDIARLPAWEQHIWAAHNVAPDGKVSSELIAAQVRTRPASTYAVEEKLIRTMRMLETSFLQERRISLFTHDVDDEVVTRQVCRFNSSDQASLLRLAKEITRVFSDRLNVGELRKLATHTEKHKLGSNKLLQDIVAQKIGAERAREIFGPIVGAYDMRVGDAHPTSSRIAEAIALAGIDETRSFLRQGEQLIFNFGRSIWWMGRALFVTQKNSED